MDVIDSSLVEQIELRMIRPSRFAVRNRFNERDLEDRFLMQSIRVHGLLQPIVVRPFSNGFEIVAGHRRFQACRILRWRFIACKICDLSDMNAFEIQLSENIQRKSMNPLEEAEAFRKYVVDFGWGGVSDLAHRIGKSEEYVSHRIQLLTLPDDVQKQIISNQIKLSQAMELTSLPLEKQVEVVDQIVGKNLTVRQIRKIKSTLGCKNDEAATNPFPEELYSVKIIKKTSLALKIALARIDSLIDDMNKRGNTKEKEDMIIFLMGLRLKIHSMIDESIHFRNKKLAKV